MSWFGPALSPDQHDVCKVVDELLGGVDPDDVATVRELPGALAALGLWTVGVPEEFGGGGADWPITALVIERLSRVVPELGVACAHAHAAALAVPGDAHDDLRALLHSGAIEVVVLDSSARHVRVDRAGGQWTGQIDRFDAFDPDRAHVVVLGDESVLIEPAGISVGRTQRTTGLTSLRTVTLTLDCTSTSVRPLPSDAAAVRSILLRGLAVVAAGIAGAAVDAASGYAAQRHQFGGPLAALPVVRASLDDHVQRTAALTHAVFAGAPDSLGAIAVVRLSCDLALEVADAALQVHGGYGYLREYRAERSLRDALSLRASVDIAGATSILQLG
ncbi:acyl-CoA dehydrogenase family protein [Pseudonocardia sp. CA-107938]|uniref:acyl-CoA dehydrogenase family protein n=1 Tax=Pseudonocardia sp. CA-107938 TaxID=3240021 RepID=UPI003D94F3A5